MKEACKSNLTVLKGLVQQLNKTKYTQPIVLLSGATVGQHVRHILEFYECLLVQMHSGQIDYSKRKRNKNIESVPGRALKVLEQIQDALKNIETNKTIHVVSSVEEGQNKKIKSSSSIERELMYCFDHSIHHQALIKIALIELKFDHLIDESFGIAPSTLNYRKCVQ